MAIINSNQILGLKSIISEMKNSLDDFIKQQIEHISKLRSTESIHSEEQKETETKRSVGDH